MSIGIECAYCAHQFQGTLPTACPNPKCGEQLTVKIPDRIAQEIRAMRDAQVQTVLQNEQSWVDWFVQKMSGVKQFADSFKAPADIIRSARDYAQWLGSIARTLYASAKRMFGR